MLVLVTGSTGFVGRHVLRALLAHGHDVCALAHTPGREGVFPAGIRVSYGDISDARSLAASLADAEAVVHLVAIIRETRGMTFDQINRQGAANVAAAAKAQGVKHFVQVSAVGATSDHAFPYLHSKWLGEQEVINSGAPYTILRPSLIFGPGDEFLNSLAGTVRVFPVVPVVGSGRNLFQPIAVTDVSRCIALTLGREDLKGQTIEIGGPHQLSYNDIMRIISRTLNKRPRYLHLPVSLMRVNVAILERFQPRPPATTEQLKMVAVPNIAELGTVERTFGFTPQPLEGNIDFIKSVGFVDGLKIVAGFMPSHIRDH